MNNIDEFHALEGTTICFKPISINDVEAIHSYASNPDVSRFIGWKLMNTLEETTELVETMLKREIAGTHLYASVVIKNTQTIIGTVMVFDFDKITNQAEVGYVFHQDYWGKGYGTQCLSLISDFAFDILKLHKLHASVTDANIGSARMLEKNNFELEGRLKDHYYVDNKYYDALLFGKIKNN